jgi:hypothetical protein
MYWRNSRGCVGESHIGENLIGEIPEPQIFLYYSLTLFFDIFLFDQIQVNRQQESLPESYDDNVRLDYLFQSDVI